MSVEPLEVHKQVIYPASLNGEVGQPTESLICYYFPPHVALSQELLDQADERYLEVIDIQGYPAEANCEGGIIQIDRVIQIKCSNGMAVYLLAKADEYGIRQGVLWRLI